MNILLASAEVTPFAKAGGLADVASYLPIEWQKFGQKPRSDNALNTAVSILKNIISNLQNWFCM